MNGVVGNSSGHRPEISTRRFGRATLRACLALSLVLLASCTGTSPSTKPATPSGIDLSTFPGPSTTGVPKGTKLSVYKGPCTISANTAINDKRVECDALVITSGKVVIKRSELNRIDLDTDGASLVIEDSSVDAGKAYAPALGYQNVTARRIEAKGGQHSVLCSVSCTIEDSWLHGQYLPPDQPWHLNGYLSNGGHDVTLRRNTISCDVASNDVGGSCSSDAALFGDFAPISDYLIEGNLFVANPKSVSYCLYAGSDEDKKFGSDAQGVVVKDNVFERGPGGKCGSYGAVTSFGSEASGTEWSGNRWDDGESLTP